VKNEYDIPIAERHVQAIWYDRELRPPRLFTRTGESVRVVHPGEWNLVSGPDFRGAVLEVGAERRRLVGDVEIHLSPSGWDAHGHGTDPAYRNVIAHVTWRDGRPPASLPPNAVSICLGRFLASDMQFSPASIDVAAYPANGSPVGERPCRRRTLQDPERMRRAISQAGAWRLRAKAERIGSLLRSDDRRQVFYAEVMNALGYSRNGVGFRAVAAAVPYAAVVAEPGNASAAFLAAATFVAWDRDRLRPNNAPEARLASAARLFTETDVIALADVEDLSRDSCMRMLAALTAGHFVGRGRAAAILANVVVPYAMACGRVRELPGWLPPEDVCADVRRVAGRMFGGDHNPRAWYATNGLYIQGLIQIDREWCARLHPACSGCGSGRTWPLPTARPRFRRRGAIDADAGLVLH